MLILNLFAGSGAGKSSLAAATFAELKYDDISCELVTEQAKSVVWDESYKLLQDQILLFAQQHHQIARLEGKVDVAVTDSPLLLSIVYGAGMGNTFNQLVLDRHLAWKSLNVFVKRVKPYHQVGRVQTEQEALMIDERVREVLDKYHVNYIEVEGKRGSETIVASMIKDILNTKRVK